MASLLTRMLGVCAALTVLLALQHAVDAKRKVFDINQKVKEFADKLARQHKTKVSWWDMYGKSEKLLNEKYKKYHVTADAHPLSYGTLSGSTQKPRVVYATWFHNEQSDHPQDSTIKRTTRHVKHAQWFSTKSLNIDVDVRSSLSLMGTFSLTAGVHATYDLRSGESHMEREEVEYTIEHKITVPPLSSVKVEWVITDSLQTYPWTADVVVDGWFALWFEQRVHNHHLWFHPIDAIKDPELKLHDPSGVVYTAEGVSEGVTEVKNELRVKQYDLQTYGLVPVNVTTFRLPLDGKTVACKTIRRTRRSATP